MSWIYVPFSYLMKGCLFIAGNHYIFALLFFAIAMELILLPLKIKQQKSSIMMAKVKPKEMAIREKYKGREDRATQQKMTMEIQNMYQENGYNQFSGCLPLLVQLPIVFILFAIVRNPVSYATNLTNNNENFVPDNAQITVEFYEDVKSSLYKNEFTAEDYEELIAKYNGYQATIGASNKDDEKSEAGNLVYRFDKAESKLGSAAEMEISRLMIDGRDDLQSLVDDGKIDPDILTRYDALGFDSYRDELPEYHVGPLNLLNQPAFKGIDAWLLIIPLLTFLTSFLSTKLTKRFNGTNQTDANGNPVGGGLFMEVGMPLITAIFTFSFPAAIGVYWVWRTLISMVESFILAKAMPIPKVTEEQIAEARKEMKSKQKKKKVITIEVDEDDTSYDDLVVRKSDSGSTKQSRSADPTQRTPRRIEMLTADDDEDTASGTAESTESDAENEE
ncbi:MAG: membrane protein insertase YidC [Clostridia bacterium]|nr:membrane protein insertase YidC [Clostridia bacterium]